MRRLVLLCVVACGDEGAPGVDAAGPGSDGGPGMDAAAANLPAPGSWRYASYTPTQDTCAGAVDGDGDFTIEHAGAGFRIVRASTPASTCSVDAAKNFTCTTPDEVRDMRPGTDAVLTGRFTLGGRVTTATLMSGMQSVEVSCTGSECNQVDPAACIVMANITVSKQ